VEDLSAAICASRNANARIIHWNRSRLSGRPCSSGLAVVTIGARLEPWKPTETNRSDAGQEFLAGFSCSGFSCEEILGLTITAAGFRRRLSGSLDCFLQGRLASTAKADSRDLRRCVGGRQNGLSSSRELIRDAGSAKEVSYIEGTCTEGACATTACAALAAEHRRANRRLRLL
jgi:hypothetical protein